MAAKAKARTLIVRLISTAQTGFFYTTQRLRTGPKLSAIKYDPKGAPLVIIPKGKEHLGLIEYQLNNECSLWKVKKPKSRCLDGYDVRCWLCTGMNNNL